jgi:hypothetical protein
MNVFRNLFAKSPFEPLQAHMEKVAMCVNKLETLFAHYWNGDTKKVEKITEEISDLEHAADLTKNEIRNNLPKGLFLAISRAELLEILSLQDRIADKAEDIAVMMSIKKLEPLEGLQELFEKFLSKNIETVNATHKIMQELDELLEASFGGKEAEKVKLMVEEVAFMEHEADVLQWDLTKAFYNSNQKMSTPDFILWNKILRETAALSNTAEKLANRVRMLLEVR